MDVKARDTGVDLVKTIAVFGVILIHISAVSYPQNILGLNWALNLFWSCVSRASVPLFLMCTGALFLAEGKEVSAKKIWSKNMVRIVVALFFWAALYGVFRMTRSGGITKDGLFSLLCNLLFFKHENHLYYLHMVILIYAFLPVLATFFGNAGKKRIIYALAVWYALGVVYPTMAPFYPLSEVSGIPAQWRLNIAYGSFGYVILGAYLKKYPIKRVASVSLLIIGFIGVFVPTLYMSRACGSLRTNFLEGMSVGVSLIAAGIFSLCLGGRLKRSAGFFTACSKASFCIYLTHMFIVTEIEDIILRFSGYSFLSVPFLSALVFAASFAVYLLMSNIPIVKKWLI